MTFNEGLLLTTILALCVGTRCLRRLSAYCLDCKDVRLHRYRNIGQFQGSCTYATCPACGKHVRCGGDSISA